MSPIRVILGETADERLCEMSKAGGGGLELLSLDGLRTDGRRPDEVRRIRCKMGTLPNADGSAYFEQGNTKVAVAVYGPRDVTQRAKALPDRALVNCEYEEALFAAAGERRRGWKGDRRSTETANTIRRTLESVIETNLYPRTQIDIFIEVIQADGGQRCAAINAATLALINAGVPMKDFICACSAGWGEQAALVDLNAPESSGQCTELQVALLPNSRTLAFSQADSKIASTDILASLTDAACDGAVQIYEVLSREVRLYTLGLIESRGLVSF